MALKHLAVIAARLIAAGRPADEPVAIVSKATLPGQRVLRTSLGHAAADAAAAGIEPPAIVAVGPVVRFSDTAQPSGVNLCPADSFAGREENAMRRARANHRARGGRPLR